MSGSLPAELIDLDPYLRPILHMSPFDGKFSGHAVRGPLGDESAILASYAACLTGEGTMAFLTCNGREALNLALSDVITSREQIVAILTPSGCGYVSGCVTKEIEKFCRWHFGFTDDAAAVVLIHEFGHFVELPQVYRDSRIPVIEDCAYAMVDRGFSPIYGQQGDYVVYSLPKALPMQFGGLLITRTAHDFRSHLTAEGRVFLLRQLARHAGKLAAYNKARLRVYRQMRRAAKRFGVVEIFPPKEQELPHSFLAALDTSLSAQKVKASMNEQGIESSVFYGGGGYFLPCHQQMNVAEIDYLFLHLRRAFDQAEATHESR